MCIGRHCFFYWERPHLPGDNVFSCLLSSRVLSVWLRIFIGYNTIVLRRHRICNRCPRVDLLDTSWNVMAHAQKTNFVFRRNGRVHLNRRGGGAAAVQSTTGSRGVGISGNNAVYTMFRGSVKSSGYPSTRQFPLHFPSRASPCTITFQLDSSNAGYTMFRGSVKSTGYPLISSISPSLPLPCVTMCHHISTGLYQIISPSL
jgi:hypothetical protein